MYVLSKSQWPLIRWDVQRSLAQETMITGRARDGEDGNTPATCLSNWLLPGTNPPLVVSRIAIGTELDGLLDPIRHVHRYPVNCDRKRPRTLPDIIYRNSPTGSEESMQLPSKCFHLPLTPKGRLLISSFRRRAVVSMEIEYQGELS